ncbi:26 proteasome complex subunit family protein [Babesia bovis T2Bo]|uniref:26 proteasome complex subunit SEM1, putative n=1 Tax=Babesia bovis TaxID=5865 RepID=A7ATI9_BABBO|nr:26 proteasome complex subunit family protein [Babesia bovis T2Bo]EDO06250.1 26 proteasome complex subunit family protein [Babesia bovis T2Bo]|eukprot:XP_001609818.1 26 proteasome complex subunit SEM1 [Babesia bovis T2Bo]
MENDEKQTVSVEQDVDMDKDMEVFIEPDNELEEFDEIDTVATVDDPEILNWNSDWESAGWDDVDVDSDFVKRILQELENYRKTIE